MRETLNSYGRERRPCLFIIDYEMKSLFLFDLAQCEKERVFYSVRNLKNFTLPGNLNKKIGFDKYPVSYQSYERAFQKVQEQLGRGNTYLVNLTFPTEIKTNLTLHEIFLYSRAPYKLLFKDRFVVFSPEQFIAISDNELRTFPMKGTINAAVPGADEKILADEKEKAEHVTIVDLLRNDVGIVARRVFVDDFRSISEVHTHEGRLLQVSSAVRGELDPGWHERLGDIVYGMLPAGSVTGAPKKKTVEIIKKIENYSRGFYTGIFGLYDGQRLDSAVMIRFIERTEKGGLVYKSGGGITSSSTPESEYREMVEKVYVPIARDN
jgi:para-aminobenzoate synthetase component 1